MPLRLKLAFTAALLTFLGLALGLGITYWSLLGLQLVDLDRESRLLAEIIHDAVVFRSENVIRIPAVVESYLTDERGVSAAQVYLNGELLWEGGVINAPRPLDPEGLMGDYGARSVSDWRVFSLITEGEGLTVQVARPLLSTWDILEPYAGIAIPLCIIITMLAGTVAWFSVGRALRPLRQLTEATVNFDSVEQLPLVPGRDEPAQLARSFAALLDRLKKQRQRESEFLAYAAHELRTPISALRAGLESAKNQKVAASPSVLTRLHREALRLETLAQNLLALSRAEAGHTRPQHLDLADLAADAYDRFLPLILEKGLELKLDNQAATIHGDERLLQQALDNMLANALRFTPQGSIRIESGLSTEEAFLRVHDNGPGIPVQLSEGLGLRVCQAVAHSHGGRLEFQNQHGTQVSLLLPKGL